MPSTEYRDGAPGPSDGITSETVANGGMSSVNYLPADGAAITFSPGAGCTGRVFKSTSRPSDIRADLADGSLTYANLIAGTQPTTSRWMLWSSGAVTSMTSEGPADSAGDVAVIATATGGAGTFEVAR